MGTDMRMCDFCKCSNTLIFRIDYGGHKHDNKQICLKCASSKIHNWHSLTLLNPMGNWGALYHYELWGSRRVMVEKQ